MDWIGMDYTDKYTVEDNDIVCNDVKIGNVDICNILNEYDKLLEQYILQLKRKDIVINGLRKQIDSRINIFNEYIENVDDKNVKEALMNIRYSNGR